jgi:FkbM family methyltransferase
MKDTHDAIHALTSLAPVPRHVEVQRAALRSWADAGLQVRSFNHPDEIPALTQLYDITFIPTTRTSGAMFGQPFIPIRTMLDWATEHGGSSLIINADIQLQLAPWELKRIRWASDGGLCYFVRYNHDGNLSDASPEPYGIDAFLMSGQDATLMSDSPLSMGQPFWDYWLPHVFRAAGRRITCVQFPAAFHKQHPVNWSSDGWHRCALEFARLTGTSAGDGSLEACTAMALRVRQAFDQNRISLTQRPFGIRDWVERTFSGAHAKTFLELGAHLGTDTEWLSRIPGVTIHAFEPDPRNHPPPLPNVTVHREAIADFDGRSDFVLSERGWGQVWTHSSSLQRPKRHLHRYPVTFGETITVPTCTLDTFAKRAGLATVDFIWADIQGAEGAMVRGGLHILSRTRYLYTEYSDDEMYEGQSTLCELLRLLPDFHVLELWEDDVLLENRSFRGRS